MTLHIPDDILKQSGLSEQQLLLELACRLFDAGRLDFTAASRLAKVDRVDFEGALRERKIAVYRPTLADMEDEAAALARFRELRRPA